MRAPRIRASARICAPPGFLDRAAERPLYSRPVSPELNLPVFLAAIVAMQGLLTLWSVRASGSTPTALLVGLLPLVGIPYQLWQLRARLVDNHIAGAITYLALVASCFGFYFFYLFTAADETPWMLIHTMAGFAFLGNANLIGTRLKD